MPGQEAPLSVFVSSTVQDFRDLRSALKVWFEELGFEVHMSEFVDFGRPIDSDTIKSCMEVIERCDYFVLLVGGRRGEKYGEGSSITREEFRHAVELAKQGKIKIVAFIRDEVMTALYERRTLRGIFERGEVFGGEVIKEAVSVIDETASYVLEDPGFTRSFVDEVRRKPLRDPSLGPSAGVLWTYHFKGFGDIVTALRTTMPVRRSLRRQALLANLDWELKQLIASLLTKNSSSVAPHTSGIWIWRLRQDNPSLELSSYDQISLDEISCGHAAIFAMFAGTEIENMELPALQDAIRSGEFLVFDPQKNRLVPGDFLQLMYRLASEFGRAKKLRAGLSLPIASADIQSLQASATARRGVSIKKLTLGCLFGLDDALQNVMRLAVALHRYIQTGELNPPPLKPTSPFDGIPDAIAAEQVTPEEVEAWLNYRLPRQEITGIADPDLTRFMPEIQAELRLLADQHPAWAPDVETRFENLRNTTELLETYTKLEEALNEMRAEKDQ